MHNRIFFPKLHKLDLSTLDTPTLHKLIRKLIKRLEQSTHKSNMRLKVMHGGTNKKLFDKLIQLIENNNITKMNKYIGEIDIQNDDGNTPLIIALRKGSSPEMIQILLNKGADVNFENYAGETPLMIALIMDSSLEIIRILLNNDADVNFQNDDGETPLMIALSNKYSYKIIQAILDKDADVNVQNIYGQTPLMFAFLNKYSDEIIQVILDKGADVNVTDDRYGLTPLMLALSSKYSSDINQMLLNKGVYVNVQNIYGQTPLMIALVYKCSDDIIQAILDKGADVNVKEEQGMTPLMIALARKCSDEIIRAILNKGADVNLQNKGGKMTIDYAYEEYRDNDIYTTIRDRLRTGCKDDLEIINYEQINEVDDKYFYSFTIGNFKYCFDILNLFTLIQTSQKNPWTREDIPDYIISDIKKRYAYVRLKYKLPKKNNKVPESSVMTATLASLSNLVPYMNDSTLFRDSNEDGIASLLERLVDYEVLTANDSTQLTNMTDLNAKKLALIQLVMLKLRQNSQLGTNVQYAYNETFGNSEDTSSYI